MSDGAEPVGTLGMIANMFGMGPLFEAAQSPDFHAYAQSIIAAIIQTQQRCERIEERLDALCRHMGVADARPVVEYLPRLGPDAVRPAVPEQQRPAGPGGNPAASRSPDNGDGAHPPPTGLADAPFALPPDLADLLAAAGSRSG